jgi:hypothetical protein
MASQTLYGAEHNGLLDWLSGEWIAGGPPVCIVEGFPGVGKSEVAGRLGAKLAARDTPSVFLDMPEPGDSQVDDLILTLSEELALAGKLALAEAVNRGDGRDNLLRCIQEELREPLVIVIDEFQRAVAKESGEPSPVVRSLLDRIARRAGTPGRLLLLTNRSPRGGKWSERLEIRSLGALARQDGIDFLSDLLKRTRREIEVPAEKRPDVVGWVGGNPRALRTVVAALATEPLDKLIGIKREAWELRDREVSPDLILELERGLLHHVIGQLDESQRALFQGCSVYRKAFDANGMDRFAPAGTEGVAVRRALADLFLLRHERGWYRLEPVAREIAQGVLRQEPHRLRGAHSGPLGTGTRRRPRHQTTTDAPARRPWIGSMRVPRDAKWTLGSPWGTSLAGQFRLHSQFL